MEETAPLNQNHSPCKDYYRCVRDLTHLCSSKGTETTSNINQKLYYHVIGTEQSEDILVAAFPEHPKWHSSVTVSTQSSWITYSHLFAIGVISSFIGA